MMSNSKRRIHRRRLSSCAAVGVATTVLACFCPAGTAGAAASSWQRYLLTPPAHPAPVKVLAIRGNVTNAQALVTGHGVATLTASATGERPEIVLDYGEEVGGVPHFHVTSVRPAGPASSVTLHSAFSETRQYVYTPGSTTLAGGAAAGTRVLHVASVEDFVVGDSVTVGNGLNAQTRKITHIGSARLHTELTRPAAVGASNIKVTDVGTLVPGDSVRVGSERARVADVGTASASAMLTAAVAAGGTTLPVDNANGFKAGDTITVGSETATVVSANPGFPTSTITIARGLQNSYPRGTAVSDPGSGITLTAPLRHAHAAGAPVDSQGSGITLNRPLPATYPSGATVTSSPGLATGDYTPNGPGNSVDVAVAKRGDYTAGRAGGFRYQEIELDSPGTVRLSRADITFDAYRATPSKYQGHFLSSSNELNRLFYSGAYTVQMNMLPPSAARLGIKELVDGAKRDQRIWSGDLLAEIATLESTLGSNAAPYIKSDLQYLVDNAAPSGELASVGQFLYYSVSYSIDTALAAIEYFRYTDDAAFARSVLPALRNELRYLDANKDDKGLIVTYGFPGMDWAFDNGPSVGEVSYYNILYYHLLTEMSYLEAHVGSKAHATRDTRLAARQKSLVNKYLYSPSLGSYVYTNLKPTVIPQDANVASVLWGVAPKNRVKTILDTVKSQLWTTYGTKPWSDNAGFRDVMSPYITGFEVDARFAAGDPADAMNLLDRLWGYMLRSPDFNGTFWEELQYDGSLWNGPHDSLAHGWASGPTYQSTQYILGVKPVDPGYRTWSVAPVLSGLRWAQGTVPTAYGALDVSWRNSASGFDITVKAPAETSGTITVPGVHGTDTVTVGGSVVAHAAGAAAVPVAVRVAGGNSVTVHVDKR